MKHAKTFYIKKTFVFTSGINVVVYRRRRNDPLILCFETRNRTNVGACIVYST